MIFKILIFIMKSHYLLCISFHIFLLNLSINCLNYRLICYFLITFYQHLIKIKFCFIIIGLINLINQFLLHSSLYFIVFIIFKFYFQILSYYIIQLKVVMFQLILIIFMHYHLII